MRNNLQIVVGLALIVLLLALINPFHVWAMPSMMLVGTISVVAVLFLVLVGFILTEAASDERDEAHRTLAGRAGFLAGAAVLTLALLVEGLHYMVDPWIAGALAAMIAAKVVARLAADRYR